MKKREREGEREGEITYYEYCERERLQERDSWMKKREREGERERETPRERFLDEKERESPRERDSFLC